VPYVVADDKRALRTLRWQHRGDPCATDEKIFQAIDNACASSGFPFYLRGFSLKEFCKSSPLQRFAGDPVLPVSKETAAARKTIAKKNVADLVAQRGGSWWYEHERIEREGSDATKEWYTEMLDGVRDFSEFIGWRYDDADQAETCSDFLNQVRFAWYDAKEAMELGKEILPGILMCKVIDKCIEERHKDGSPVIPIPKSSIAYKDRLRSEERLWKESEEE
jgi:hypothetical protein